MGKWLILCAVLALGIATQSNAGTEIVRDYSRDFNAQAPPPPAYSYVPGPPQVYFAPPRVVVYPSVRYVVVRPARVFAYHRVYHRPVYCAP
jgi:hypothetical protein